MDVIQTSRSHQRYDDKKEMCFILKSPNFTLFDD